MSAENKCETEKNRLLNLKEVCQLLGIKISMGRTLVFKNQIPVIRIGKLLRFDQEDIKRWVKQMKYYEL